MTDIKKPGNRSGKAQYREIPNGYRQWRSWNKDGEEHMYVHRLLAISEYGFEAVAGNHVHHINGHKFDNRPENIEVKSEKQHLADHISDGPITELEKIRMAQVRKTSGASYRVLSNHFERAQSAVYNAVQEVHA